MPSDSRPVSSRMQTKTSSGGSVLQVILFASTELIPLYQEAAKTLPLILQVAKNSEELKEETEHLGSPVDLWPVLFVYDVVDCQSSAVLESMISISKVKKALAMIFHVRFPTYAPVLYFTGSSGSANTHENWHHTFDQKSPIFERRLALLSQTKKCYHQNVARNTYELY
eukprot:gb/GECG01006682.1/.p1 GENE.gb/GECG01006682.1/~~gb/GECG01006682.1/.p1  ORF type:complete len:169 (+),score=15.69 gb/GECG01006682.1/:1-507(+)